MGSALPIVYTLRGKGKIAKERKKVEKRKIISLNNT
jgi:hypothetical protein